jgi:hypothetical protein
VRLTDGTLSWAMKVPSPSLLVASAQYVTLYVPQHCDFEIDDSSGRVPSAESEHFSTFHYGLGFWMGSPSTLVPHTHVAGRVNIGRLF